MKNISPLIKKELEIPEPLYVYEVNGCELCNFKGYRGRVGLYEVLSMTEELSDTILKSPIENLILKIAQKQGMLTMAQEGIIKVFAGQTTIDEVIRVTQEI